MFNNMVLVEFREAAINKAWDALDEAKEYGKRVKLAMCSLEDALCEVYEAEEYDTEDSDSGEFDTEFVGNDIDVNYKNSSATRRRSMHDFMNNRNMRMRRKRPSRYSY